MCKDMMHMHIKWNKKTERALKEFFECALRNHQTVDIFYNTSATALAVSAIYCQNHNSFCSFLTTTNKSCAPLCNQEGNINT